MTIEEQYKIIYINGKRHYYFDIAEKLPLLECTIPYKFKYKEIEIIDSAWTSISLKILTELDKRNPHDRNWFLNLKYSWSSSVVFSETKRTNFVKFKDLYFNVNHTSTHAMMSIQCLLNAYGVNLKECEFIIRRQHVAEPEECREYFANKTISEFKNALKFRNYSDEYINKVISNFGVVNALLKEVSIGFDNFFLFDDLMYFQNYKIKTIEKARIKYFSSHKNVEIINKLLEFLEDFYKHRGFYKALTDKTISSELKATIQKEIQFLFESLCTVNIADTKLFARMNLIHPCLMEQLDEMNNVSDFFLIAKELLGKRYYFKNSIISMNKDSFLNNDGIIKMYAMSLEEITITNLNEYADRMHLDKLDNYLKFINECGDKFVQVSMERMVRKDILNIKEDKIDKIKQTLTYFINSFGVVNSINYCGYSSLPEIGAKWNKYLLLGIVRSYLRDIFKIDYIGDTYRTLEFKISLLK